MLRRLLLCLLVAAPWTAMQAAAEPAPVFVRASKPALARPHDVLLSPDKKLLYVADQNNNAVTVLDADTLAVKGAFAKGELSRPHDIAWDPQGRMLVADTGNDRIAIYNVKGTAGRFVGEIKGGLSSTEGVGAGPDGTVYATSVGDNSVVVFRNGKQVARTADDYTSPHDIALGPEGRLWVADSGAHRVKILDPKTLKVLRVLDQKSYGFDGVRYFDFDPAGRAYLADKYADRLVVLDRSLKTVAVIKKLNHPEGVVVHGKRIWIADTYNDRVVLYAWK